MDMLMYINSRVLYLLHRSGTGTVTVRHAQSQDVEKITSLLSQDDEVSSLNLEWFSHFIRQKKLPIVL
jgi:hypothetical protein